MLVMPMSSPKMTRMFGFFAAAWARSAVPPAFGAARARSARLLTPFEQTAVAERLSSPGGTAGPAAAQTFGKRCGRSEAARKPSSAPAASTANVWIGPFRRIRSPWSLLMKR